MKVAIVISCLQMALMCQCMVQSAKSRTLRQRRVVGPMDEVTEVKETRGDCRTSTSMPCKNMEAEGNIRDFNDLITWVKNGKPPVHCSYDDKGSTKVLSSLRKEVDYPSSYVIPVDDGYVYEWTNIISTKADVLVRVKRNYSKPLTGDQYSNVFLPESGISILAKIAGNYGDVPIHGVEGFYSYDHFDGDYESPTSTNAEEDLLLNVTMVATIMDVLGRLFPEKLLDVCAADGYVNAIKGESIGRNKNRPFIPATTPWGRGQNRVKPLHTRPYKPQRLNDRYNKHLTLGRTLLMPLNELHGSVDTEPEGRLPAHNRTLARPLGDDKVIKDYEKPAGVVKKAIDIVF